MGMVTRDGDRLWCGARNPHRPHLWFGPPQVSQWRSDQELVREVERNEVFCSGYIDAPMSIDKANRKISEALDKLAVPYPGLGGGGVAEHPWERSVIVREALGYANVVAIVWPMVWVYTDDWNAWGVTLLSMHLAAMTWYGLFAFWRKERRV